MKITIITKDEIFSRMLFWEISQFGAQISIFEDFCAESQDESERSEMTILEASVFSSHTEEVSCLEHTQIILFGYEDEFSALELKIPSGFQIFKRPFLISEMLAYIFETNDESLLGVRPAKRRKSPADSLILNAKSQTVIYHKETIELTQREFALLSLLIKHKGETVTRAQAAQAVWGKDGDTETNVVDVYIRYLREKLDEHFDIKMISTVRGQGYTIKTE